MLRKKILRVLGTLCLLIALLVFLLHTSFVRKMVLNRLQNYLAKSLNLSLSVKSLDYNLFTWKMSLKTPKAATHDKPALPPFFQADEINIRLTSALILGKKLDFGDIRVINPRVDIRVNSDGTLNIPPQLFRESTGPSLPLIIRHLGIEEGHISYRDPAGGLQVNIPGIHLSGTFIDKGKQEIMIRVNEDTTRPGQLVYQNKRLRLGKARVSANLDKKDIHITLVGTELQSNETIGINGQVQWNNQGLYLGKFHINVAGGEIHGKGEFFSTQDPATKVRPSPHRISLSWKSLNLQTPLIKAYFPHPLYSETFGNLDLEVSDFSLDGLRGNVEVKLAPLPTPVPNKGLIPLSGRVHALLEPRTINISDFYFTVPSHPAHQVTLTRLQGNFHLKNQQFQGELYGSLKGEHDINGHVHLFGQMTGDLANPCLRIRLAGKGIQVDNWMFLVPRGNLVYENRQLKTQDLVIRFKEKDELLPGQVGISGIFPLASEETQQPNPLNIAINAKEIPLELLMNHFQKNFPVKGILSMTAHVLPHRIEADILLANGSYRLQDQTELVPGEIRGWFKLVNSRLNYQIRAPHLSMEIHGSGRLASPYPLEGTVYLDIPDFNKLSQQQGFNVLEGISGRVAGQVNFQLDLENTIKTVKLEANIEKFFMRTWEKELMNQEPIRISFTPAGITVINLKLNGPGSQVRISGFLPQTKTNYGGTDGLTFSAQIDPALLNPFVDPYRLKGSFYLQTRVSGSLAEPVTSSELILKEFSIEREPSQPEVGTGKGPNSRLEGQVKISGNLRDLRDLMAEADFSSLHLDIPGLPTLSSAKPVKLRLENGRCLVDQLTLTDESNWSQLDVSGAANLIGQQSLDLRITGQVDARLVNSFFKEIQLAGKNVLDLWVRGEIQKPEISGSLDLQNIEMRYYNPNLYVNELNGKLRLTGGRVFLETLKGNLNGGPTILDGEIAYTNRGISQMELKLTAKESHFEYPPGLFSEVSGGLTLTFDGKDYLLKGIVDINEGIYKEPFNVMSELFTYIRGAPAIPVPEEADSFWGRLNLDINLRTSSPLLINNNISRSELSADLSLRGYYNYLSLSGRLTIAEGGEIYLGSNRYLIESGIINFVNPYRMEPDLRIRSRTKVQNYDIVLELNGTPETLKASFTSTPSLSEPNIISLLVTGRTLESVSGSLLDATGSQALSYIGNTFSGKIQQFTKQKLGIDQVRIDGSLIASKNNPGARLTVGQRLTSNLELTLSQDLKQAQDRSWILDYKPFPNFTLQGINQDSERYSAAIMHDIRFGKLSGEEMRSVKKSRAKPTVVENLQVSGDTHLPETEIRRILRLRKGKIFNYFRFQADRERLRNLYIKNNYLWAEIKSRRQEGNGTLNIMFTINAGPQIFLEFRGSAIPHGLKSKLVKLWSEGQFVQQSKKNVIEALRLYFIKKGYCQVTVSAGTPNTAANNVLWYPFTVKKGLKYRPARFLFQGNRSISGKRLRGFLKANQLKGLVFNQPDRVAREMKQYYFDQGFLGAHIPEPRIRFFPSRKKVTVTFPVEEGPLFRINQISFSGNRSLDKEILLRTIKVKKHQVFSLSKLQEAKYEIAAAYARKGFNAVHVISQKRITAQKKKVDLTFLVEENHRGVIQEITITGNSLTRESVVRRELSFKPGDIMSFLEINKSRKKLYDLGIFQRVNIETIPLNAPLEGETSQTFRVEIQLSEIKPYRLKTGLRWDTEKSLGVLAELDNPNIAGRAQYLGASLNIDKKETRVKTYYRFPYFLGKKISTEFFLFTGKEKESFFTVNRSGLTLQQQFRPQKSLFCSWNYTLERTHTFLPTATTPPSPSPALFIEDDILNLAHLTAAFSYDRRNSMMNPTRGFFFSSSYQHAARFLGSQANFSRFLSECHWYIPYRSFLVSATSIRVGLGKGLGQEKLPGERFFAGGGGTIRGFDQDLVGPLDPEGNPLGGESLFIFKQELRVRLHDLFSIVLFTDLGNVYNTAAEFDIFNVRKSAGFGIRIHTDPLLLRFDWGFKLDRQRGESPSRVFLSIGQAF